MMVRACKCGGIIRDGKCNRCGGNGKTKKTREHHLGFDWTWRKLSKAYRQANPLCEDCTKQGRVIFATQVHHKISRRERPALRYAWDNLMALCDSCHSKRTAKGE
jgi:5-methylcytosine-specific restriction endonuclease McrA